MIRHFKKRLAILSIIALCISCLLPSGILETNADPVTAQPAKISVDAGSKLGGMELDEQRGYLYATAYETSELLFINKDTLEIDKRLAVGNQPRGMELAGDKLYVALSGATFIAVVNLDTQSVDSTIATQVAPYQIAVDGNSLYYADGDQWCTIHRMDLLTGMDTVIQKLIYKPLLAVDHNSHRLYAGETGLSRYKLSAYDATYGEQLWSIEPHGSFATTLLVHDSELYYDSARIDPMDTRTISSFPGSIGAVDNTYIYTNVGIYTKDEGINVATYSSDSNNSPTLITVDQSRAVYSNDERTSIIRKQTFDLPETPPQAIEYKNGLGAITFNRTLSAWTLGKDEKYLYAISTDTNRLLQIDSESFEVIADRYIGSYPVDVDIRNGVIYVALRGSTHIAKIDTADETNFMAPVIELEVGQPTTDVAAGIGKVFYTGTDSWSKVSVFDSVYRTYPDSYSKPKLVMNEDASVLFIGETDSSGSDLFRMSTSSGEVLQETKGGNNYGSNEIIEDGDYVYYAARRFAANDLSKVYGKYKDGYYAATIISALGDLVLGSNAFYDRDSFNPVYKLPFTTNMGLIKKDGSILLLAGNGAAVNPQFTLYKYSSFDSLTGEMQGGLRPLDVYFYDEDWDPKSISGELTLVPGEAASAVKSYKVSYYDAESKVMADVQDDYIYDYDKQEDGSYVYKLNKSIPNTVKYIGIIPMVTQSDGNTLPMESARKIIRLWDNDTYYAYNPLLADEDASTASIGGKVSFEAAKGEILGDRYAVFFAGEEGFVGEQIGYIEASGQSQYELPIPNGTSIPNDAITLAVQLLDQDGSTAPGYTQTEIPDVMTIAPEHDQITVINGAGATDSVTVSGLSAGDLVSVYSYEGDLYGEQIVAAGTTKAVISSLDLSEEINAVLVSVTSPGKHSSFYVLKEYPIYDGSGGESGGNTGGGDGGSSGGSGGSAGGGGGGLTGVVPPATENNTAKLTVTEVSNKEDGTSLAEVKLEDKVLKTELDKWNGTSNKLTIKVTDTAEEIKVTLGGSQLGAIVGKDKDAVLQIQSADSGFIVPAGVLGYSVKDAENTSYILTFAPLKGSSAEAAQKLLSAQSIQQVGQSYEFSIRKETPGGTAVQIHDTDRYIGHVIKLNKAGQPQDSLSAVMIDSATGQVSPVPAVFTQEGDKITATIYRKGNSVYAVVSGSGGFKDVPAASFAKTAIDKLAVRKVVEGYSEGSFKPDAAVTRAEAAALLVKALGIIPAGGTGGFKDVKPGAWYAESVSAAVKAGLFKGYTDGTFKPDQTIAQQEMIAILYQALLYGGYQAEDASSRLVFDTSAGYRPWSAEAVNAVLKEQVVKLKEDFTIKAGKPTTRAESAEMIYRMLNALKLI